MFLEHAHCQPTSASAELFQLWQFVMDKYTDALAYSATNNDDLSYQFYLCSAEGTVRVIIYNSGEVQLVCQLPLFWPRIVVLEISYQGGTFYSYDQFDDPDIFVAGAAKLTTAMGVAPFAMTLYGLLYKETVVGVVFLGSNFTNDDAYRLGHENRDRYKIGGNVEAYIMENPIVREVFPFLNEPNPVLWWQYFWEHHFNGDAICLHEHFPQHSSSIVTNHGNDNRTWLLIQSKMPGHPTRRWDERYWAWDHETQNFSTRTPPIQSYLNSGNILTEFYSLRNVYP